MKIETVTIAGFRCFGSDPIRLAVEEGITALVGNNGSGKTAFFAALAKLFGVTNAQRSLAKSDFHVAADAEAIADGATLFIDCVLGFEADGADEAVPDVFGHMSAVEEGEPLKVRIRLEAAWIDDGTPEGLIESSVRWITTLDDNFDWETSNRVNATERNFVQLIYVPASRNAFEQVTNLLKGRLWRAARWSEDLHRAAAEASRAVQDAFSQEEPAQFIAERLTRRWQQVHEADTDTTPILRLVDSRLEDLVRRAEFAFFPNEAQQVRKLEELSDGQKSLFHIALTAATLEIERDALAEDAEDGPFDQEKLLKTHLTILAIEEPENSLSPFFLSRIMLQSREISALPSCQVLFSSHSASILSRLEPEEIRYTRLDDETRRSSVRSLSLPPNGSEARRFVRLAVRAYPELYFARFVVLAEGESESIVVPRIAEAMGVPLDRSFVPVVPLGGRYVNHFWRLLEGLEIPYATLLDLDLGRRHGGALNLQSTVATLQEFGRDLSLNRSVREGEIDLDDQDDIEDAELLAEDQEHPWLKALRRERVYFSSPIVLDFAMLLSFPDAYKLPHEGGRGPRAGAQAIGRKKEDTLKTGGNPQLYGAEYDTDFAWYPYLFLATSKPEIHLAALSRIENQALARNAPLELRSLITRIQNALR